MENQDSNPISFDLSICIPTYNRAKFIGETLTSIISQITHPVEIVILDGGSTDETESVVESFRKQYPHIFYHKQPFKGGIDRDMATSVERASGKYCWLFSSDDVMKPGAIDRVLQEIKEEVDVLLLLFTVVSLDMKQIFSDFLYFDLEQSTRFDLSDPEQKRQFFSKALKTPAFFSFMSSLVIKRSKWLKTDVEEIFFNSCWCHAARIFRMLPQGLCVKYIHEPLFYQRSFNDSFMDKGPLHRLSITVDGYNLIADTIFGRNSSEAFHIRRAVKNEVSFAFLLFLRSFVRTAEEKQQLFFLIDKLYKDAKGKDRVKQFLATHLAYIPFIKTLYRLRHTAIVSFLVKGAVIGRKAKMSSKSNLL